LLILIDALGEFLTGDFVVNCGGFTVIVIFDDEIPPSPKGQFQFLVMLIAFWEATIVGIYVVVRAVEFFEALFIQNPSSHRHASGLDGVFDPAIPRDWISYPQM
jgi:hypothetical protein